MILIIYLDMELNNPIGMEDNDSDLTSRKFSNFLVDEQKVMQSCKNVQDHKVPIIT